MTALAFLLLLDYSGSMDQNLAGKAKIETLKSEVRALLSTEKAETLSAALVFGTEPSRGCRDIKPLELKTDALQKELSILKPGARGKTPLAAGLRRMMSLAMTRKIQSSIVVTDGADSCGEDPCKALQEVDAKWKPSRGRFKIQIVGFDLKNDQGLACFKNLKLKNIEVSLSEANGGSALRDQLKKNQLSDYEEGAAIRDADTARLKGLRKNKIHSKNEAGGQKANQAGAKGKLNKDEALLEITGAPATAQFSAIGTATRRWSGPYVIRLPAGSFAIHFESSNSADQKLDLGAGTHTKIPWARLMKTAETNVRLSSILNLKWTPSDATKSIHGDPSSFSTEAKLEQKDVSLSKIPFGDWKIEVTSPPWLTGLKPVNIQVPLSQENFTIDLEALYGSELQWIDNPNPSRPSVLELRANEREGRHLIPAGQKRIPIPKESEYRWLEAGA